MAFIPLPGGLRIAVEFIKDNQLVVNVYHVTTALPINTTNLTALANVFRSWWTNNGKVTASGALALSRVVVTDVSVPDGLQVVSAPSTPEAGTVSGADTPSNVAAVISWRTGFSGRSRRGRTYFGGLVASEVSTNFISAPRVTALATQYAALLTQLAAAGFVLVVASYYANGAPRTTAVATPITTTIVNNRVDTQRRRLPGEGT